MFASPFVLMAALAGSSTDSPSSSPDRTADMYSLTISGGVSLGAYEAGFNWTAVRFMKRIDELAVRGKFPRQPHLAGVTGASAGAINALLSAALWCEQRADGQADSVDKNLLHDSWLSVGLSDLLPDDPRRYRADDGLLARAAFDGVLADIRREVFGQGGNRRFIPGCRIPVGITVTRTEPEERDVEGLRTVTQRFVLPWMLEVTGEGKVVIHNQNLTADRDSFNSALWLAEGTNPASPRPSLSPEQVIQAILASSAFPVAFSPRVLCDCSSHCPPNQIATVDSCPGPDGNPITPLSCSTASGESPAGERKLCRRSYVDGGVFDNAPIGLAIDQVESSVQPTPLRPIIYVFIDPDTRRLKPRDTKAIDEKPGWGVTGNLSLFANLVKTARNVELGRAVQAKHWNVTTTYLLREAAVKSATLLQVHETLTALAAGDRSESERAPATSVEVQPKLSERLRRGRVLLRCLRRITGADPAKDGWSPFTQCAAELRSPSAQSGSPAEGSRLSKSEVVEMARRLAAVTSEQNPYRRQIETESLRGGASLEDRSTTQTRLRDRLSVTLAAIEFLAEEVDGVARSQLPEEEISQFKHDLLNTISRAQGISNLTNRMANALLEAQLRRAQSLASPDFAARIQSARKAVIGLQEGELFAPQAVEEWIEDANLLALAADRDRNALASVIGKIRRILEIRPTLQEMGAGLANLVGEAAELQQQGGGEHRLELTSRFAPLAGSQLNNFAAFLDRPLRELDYYAGVYDAIHEIAAQGCNGQDVYATDRIRPVRRRDAPSELDMTNANTQRCIGEYMRSYVELLQIRSSEKARTVFAALARAELATALGDSSKAEEILQSLSWSWLLKIPPPQSRGPVATALLTMLSKKEPCTAEAKEALCFAEPTFDEFLTSLQQNGYQAEEESMKVALSDRDRWWSATMQKIVARSSEIESTPATARNHPLKESVSSALNAGELLTRRDWRRNPTPNFELDPSTIPGEDFFERRPIFLLGHLLPYRIDLEFARGGMALAWLEPAFRVSRHFSLISVIEPVSFEFSPYRFFTTLGIRPTAHFAGLSFGVGPAFVHQWSGPPHSSVGLQANVALLQDRIGVTVGLRDVGTSDASAQQWFVALSLSDVNGLAYWLALRRGSQ